MAVIGIIRLVEFRGKGIEFAEKTIFMRRFGFIPFTNYTIQFIYFFIFFIFFIVSLSFLGVPYAKLTWGLAFLTLLLSYLVYQIIMKLWEKKRYIGSMEWALATIALNPCLRYVLLFSCPLPSQRTFYLKRRRKRRILINITRGLNSYQLLGS